MLPTADISGKITFIYLLLKDLTTEHHTSPKPVFNVTDCSWKSNFFLWNKVDLF